jgi:hypothetical protein
MEQVPFFSHFLSQRPDIDHLSKKKDIGGLIRLLQDADFTIQWKAAAALGTLGPEAVDRLIHALHENNLAGRLGAIEALADIRDGKVVDPLNRLLRDDGNSEIRWASALALGEIGDRRATGPLREALTDKDKYVRYGSAVALGVLGWVPENHEEEAYFHIAKQEWTRIPPLGEAAIEPLTRMMSDPDADFRFQAIETLGKIHRPMAKHACDRALRDADGRVRWKAVTTSKKCGVPLQYIPWSLSRRARIRKSPEAAALLNFLFLGLGYNYLGKWWGFLAFQVYMTMLVMFTLWPVEIIGTFLSLLFLRIPGIALPVPISLIFAAHAWDIARKMPDL